jgi:hypothetical protein
MNNTTRSILGVAAIVVIGLALLGGGIYFGRMTGCGGYGPNMTLAPARSAGVYGYTPAGAQTNVTGNSAFGPMGSGMMLYGMMSNGSGMMGSGMMGASSATLYGVQPLSISAAQNAVQAYLAGLRNGDLTVGEVIIFDNQAYARVDEKSTGHAALEVLVDPVTLAVYPEPGANMMWNLKYGMMAGYATGAGMMGGYSSGTGMMGGYTGGATAVNPADPMPVTPAQAVETAQRYLDTYLPGAKAETTPDTFYGYYTLEILRNGQMTGMLSVNGYTRQVILHTWHGKFVETSAK